MTLSRPSLIVLAAAVFGAAVSAAVLDRTVPSLTRGGQPFLIPALSAGTQVSQEFAVLMSRGLRGVRVEAVAPASAGTIDAALVEMEGTGAEREVRRARVTVTQGMPDCCDILFDAVRSSAGKRFRVDLRFDAAQPLRVWVLPTGARTGGLTVNGRRQSANLQFSLAGAVRAPARGAGIPLAVVLAYAAVVNGAVAAAVCALLSASNPRRS